MIPKLIIRWPSGETKYIRSIECARDGSVTAVDTWDNYTMDGYRFFDKTALPPNPTAPLLILQCDRPDSKIQK